MSISQSIPEVNHTNLDLGVDFVISVLTVVDLCDFISEAVTVAPVASDILVDIDVPAPAVAADSLVCMDDRVGDSLMSVFTGLDIDSMSEREKYGENTQR